MSPEHVDIKPKIAYVQLDTKDQLIVEFKYTLLFSKR